MAHKVILPSKAVLELTMGTIEECDNLLNAFLNEAQNVGINLGKDFKGLESFGEMDVNSDMVNTMKNAFCQIVKSKAVKEAVFVCGKRGTYNNAPLSKDSFEPETARGDYLIAIKEVVWFNLSPFFVNLNSKLSAIIQRIGTSQG